MLKIRANGMLLNVMFLPTEVLSFLFTFAWNAMSGTNSTGHLQYPEQEEWSYFEESREVGAPVFV